jgi:hypothetical protein
MEHAPAAFDPLMTVSDAALPATQRTGTQPLSARTAVGFSAQSHRATYSTGIIDNAINNDELHLQVAFSIRPANYQVTHLIAESQRRRP